MRRIHSTNTTPELIVRRILYADGYRYRLHSTSLPGRPDIVLPRLRVAIEVRGCFWHGHRCSNGRTPTSNEGYWVPKLQANKQRDKRNIRKLKALGWRVCIVWECEIRQASMAAVRRLLRERIQSTRRRVGGKSAQGAKGRQISRVVGRGEVF